MDISLNTIEYLMSDSILKKINDNKKSENNSKEYINDLKFYKKRIYQTTKTFIKNQIEKKEENKDLDELLKHYLVKLIEYFKIEDKNEILQNELLNVKKSVKFNILDKEKQINADEFIMKQPVIKENTIENYMNITIKNKKKETIVVPRSKNINIKQPEFKTKGLKNSKK